MATGKEFPLSIVLQTVDKATSGIAQINARLKTITDPLKNLNKQQDEFGKHADLIWKNFGGPKVIGGFKAVGSALSEILSKVALLAVGAGAAALAFKGIVDELDNIGDAADRMGVTATELVALRFAAGQSGASVEALDEGLMTFNKNLGLAMAGTGRMAKQLEKISPPLLRQVKAAKSAREALGLIANAMTKLKGDTRKQAALAAATGLGPELIPLLLQGAKGMKELTDRAGELSGNLEPGVKVAGDLDNAGRELGLTWLNVKAQIVAGLGPPVLALLKEIIAWVVKNQDRIGKWAAEVGTQLPKAFEWVRAKFAEVVVVAGKVSDAIGGISGAAKILAALMVGKLVIAIGMLSVALVTTPFGWVVLSIAALAAAAVLLIKDWKPVWEFFDILGATIVDTVTTIDKAIAGIIDNTIGKIKEAIDFFTSSDFLKWASGFSGVEEATAGIKRRNAEDAAAGEQGMLARRNIVPPGAAKVQTLLKVDFANAPKGTRVSTDPRSTGDVDLSVGFSMVTP